jgi:Zn2+/Cd2+-exporting ATPase
MVTEKVGDDMAASKPSLELPILLPPIEDERDQCVERLQEQLKQHKGIEAVHLRFQGGQALLCLHYDPDHVTLERVKHLATRAGASVIERYQRETLRVTSMDRADCAASIEHILQRVPGVLVA